MIINLLDLPWMVAGWRPFSWQLARSRELGSVLKADIAPIPIQLPGSVQRALQVAGLIPDPMQGLNSRLVEWVENRHWELFTDLPADLIPGGTKVELRADGLDYSGAILVDNQPVADFSGALHRHHFDLAVLADGRPHRLGIVFFETPREQGQIGFTSHSHFFKPRFSYGWDWCPRFVPVGVWDDLKLVVGPSPTEIQRIQTDLSEDLLSGSVTVQVRTTLAPDQLTLRLRLGKDLLLEQPVSATGEASLSLEAPKLWYPNGHGPQNQYTLEVVFENQVLECRSVGFKRVEWNPNPGAPADAIPWQCVVNKEPVFLAGVNWTPVNLDYHHIDEARYRRLVQLYKEMGCTVLRVWGGAYLERECFYDLCDELGLLVWQEFPLSSSGIENVAPAVPAAVAELKEIARDYIRRRRHHVSVLLWCGGNELFTLKEGQATPLTSEHPCLSALADVVAQEDPGRRFLATSPSGPVFDADEKNFGTGIHHHVHGPWGMTGTLAEWEAYWSGDDSTLRSEVGMPGATPAALIGRYCGDQNPWPANRTNPLWVHGGDWWIQWERFRDSAPNLETYCELSQELQGRALGFAAAASRRRFPECGGFLVWMGHDCFPCTANTSIIDYEGNPKPAYEVLKNVFTKRST